VCSLNRTVSDSRLQKLLGRGLFVRGQSAVELALAVPLLVLLLFAGADFGRIFYLSIGVKNAARAGAQYGSQTVITAADSTGMISAARTDASNITNLTATATECTCTSSTSVAACPASYCTNNPQATFVEVHTHALFSRLVNYPGINFATTLWARPSWRLGSNESA
jgi:Flp pilus assembly protein TadG